MFYHSNERKCATCRFFMTYIERMTNDTVYLDPYKRARCAAKGLETGPEGCACEKYKTRF